jgi:hypothetical protein
MRVVHLSFEGRMPMMSAILRWPNSTRWLVISCATAAALYAGNTATFNARPHFGMVSVTHHHQGVDAMLQQRGHFAKLYVHVELGVCEQQCVTGFMYPALKSCERARKRLGCEVRYDSANRHAAVGHERARCAVYDKSQFVASALDGFAPGIADNGGAIEHSRYGCRRYARMASDINQTDFWKVIALHVGISGFGCDDCAYLPAISNVDNAYLRFAKSLKIVNRGFCPRFIYF